jgi:hypothetical protein
MVLLLRDRPSYLSAGEEIIPYHPMSLISSHFGVQIKARFSFSSLSRTVAIWVALCFSRLSGFYFYSRRGILSSAIFAS